MTGLSAGIDACIALIDYSVDETKKQLNIISGVARQGLKDVRRSMKKLRPDTLERESLESAIEKLITETMSTSKVSIEFQSFLPSLVFEDDGSPEGKRLISESKMTGTAVQYPRKMGASAINAAYELLAGKDVDKTVTIPVKLITKDNVSEYDLERWQ